MSVPNGSPTEPSIVLPPRRRRFTVVVLFAVVVGLLLASLLLPWWTLTFSGFAGSGSSSSISTFVPGTFQFSGTNETAATCPIGGGPSSNAKVSCPALNSTASLYRGAFGLALGSIALSVGTIGLLLWGLLSPHRAVRATRFARVFAVVAVLLGAGAVLLIAGDQPSAFAADSGSSPGATPFGLFPSWCPHTPSNSFFAGCSSSSGQSIHWYPALGWVLTLVAMGVGVVGVVLSFPARRHVPFEFTSD